MEVSVLLQNPTSLITKKAPQYPLKGRLDGSHGLPRSCDLQKNVLPLPRSVARIPRFSNTQSPHYTN